MGTNLKVHIIGNSKSQRLQLVGSARCSSCACDDHHWSSTKGLMMTIMVSSIPVCYKKVRNNGATYLPHWSGVTGVSIQSGMADRTHLPFRVFTQYYSRPQTRKVSDVRHIGCLRPIHCDALSIDYP